MSGEEEAMRGRRKEVMMNGSEFLVGILFEIEKFSGEGVKMRSVDVNGELMKEAESDVSGGLNDSLNDLCNVLIF